MFGLAGALFTRGAIGSLVAGFISALALIVVWPLDGHALPLSEILDDLAQLTAVFGMLFAPFAIIVLPLTWMAFRRSRYRCVASFGMGLLAGLVWSKGLRSDLSLYHLVVVGVLSGLGAASCFLGLRAPAAPARSEQVPRATPPKA